MVMLPTPFHPLISLADLWTCICVCTWIYEAALRSILKSLPEKKIIATREEHGSDVKTQNVRHLDLIPFEKLLFSVAVKCWTPIWHEINYVLFFLRRLCSLLKVRLIEIWLIHTPFWDSCVFSLNCDLAYIKLFRLIIFSKASILHSHTKIPGK